MKANELKISEVYIYAATSETFEVMYTGKWKGNYRFSCRDGKTGSFFYGREEYLSDLSVEHYIRER